MIKIKDGDYVVIDSPWSNRRYDVRRVTKVTSQMYFYDDAWGGKTRSTRARIDEILFATSEVKDANILSDRLKSSENLKDEEHRKATDRWIKRKADLIEKATAALSPQVQDSKET
jgi:hypothetical protein